MKQARPVKRKVLRGVQANAGIEADYRRRLRALIERMTRDVSKQVTDAYARRRTEVARLAGDESPAAAMRRLMRELTRRWTKQFDDAAPRLAKWFATATHKRSDAALRKILRDAGFLIDWKMTAAQNDALQATIGEQVGLIKSIPQRYLSQVEGMVMRSVATGRDLKQLNDDLREQFGVTRRRAELIARDQNAKATATLTRVRQLEAVGQEAEAIWCHSAGGKTPRPTHVKAGRERTKYKVAEGWYDPAVGKKIWPGTEINCRCFSRLVVRGFS